MMHRSLSKLTTLARSNYGCTSTSTWLSLIVTRTMNTTNTVLGGIQMEKQRLSRLLDSSRNVEIEEATEINQVALSRDGRVLVCWHPEQPFPYELSKPLPMQTIPTETTLKVQALNPVKEVFRRKQQRMMVQELMQLTHTTKYPWFTHRRPRIERYPKLNPLNTERYREYL